ncbi:MAG: DUF3662 domain-containing protein [Anaerolineales bacterium]|nr:DUF3662 domain-containing protein [Anaerolineales bacterium]
MTVTNQLGRFEELVEKVVEGSFARLFSGQLNPQQIVARMVRTMEDNAQENIAPDVYTIHLNPQDFKAATAEIDLESILSDQILAQSRHSGLDMNKSPVVKLLPDPDVPLKTVRVDAVITGVTEERTQAFKLSEIRDRMSAQPDDNTYLIVDGNRFVQLSKPVYTLGRRLDCDIVLSDSRVSRRHAQLRWRFGRYMLFDLGSTGGTSINGKPITEAVLEPGDVFSLGGVEIIYGRDAPDGKVSLDGDTTNSWSRPKPVV